MTIARFSMGAGDRFGTEGAAQVAAFQKIQADGVDVDIVWNKSNREHVTVGTSPADQRAAAEAAVARTGYDRPFYIDADHVGMDNVDWFIPVSNFYTIDVTNCIGRASTPEAAEAFLARSQELLGSFTPEGSHQPVDITPEVLDRFVAKYLFAIDEAGRIYEHVKVNGAVLDHVEVAMDESPEMQGPADLFIILAEIKRLGIPADTVAVKFQGRFNKGVDYVGDVDAFLEEFRTDIAVINYGIKKFGLHENLKISVHTGSDKFSLYPGMGRIVRELGAGLHLKTAGTSWLEELIGLAEADGEGLAIAKDVYRASFEHKEELVAPYADVIDIDFEALPTPDQVDTWDSKTYADTLRHDQSNPTYDSNVRQLLHVGYKMAAKMGDRFTDALETYREHIERNVTENLYERHLKPLFGTN